MYVDNKAMIALCQEHRVKHKTKHITLRYFLARELQQHGQLRLAYVANRANTADIFTKALQSASSRPLVALVPSSRHAFPPCCPTGRAPPSLPAMTSLRRSGGSGDGGGGSSGSGGGHTSTHCRVLGVSGGGLVQLQRRPRETLMPQQLREWYAQRGASRSSAHCLYVIRTCARAGQTCGTVGHTQSRCFSCLSDTWRAEFGAAAELPHWLELLRQGVDIFALDNDAILTAMYALPTRTEGDSSLCVLLDPGIEAAALGAGESALPGTAPAEALHTFTLDSGASRCFFHDNTTLSPLCTCTGQNG
ncbi:unnamed protein product [Closterium sp. NIES-54]